MATVLITGGTGLVGKALSAALIEKNYEVIVLTRGRKTKADTRELPVKNASDSKLQYALWDVEKQTIDKEAIAKADCIIHLAGAGVAEKRWTKKRKKEILRSRVDSGKLIRDSVKNLANQVKVIVSASAIGWYGPDLVIPNPWPFREDAPSYGDFLGTTCKQWEETLDPLTKTRIRLVKLRTGIVLSKDEGALKEFLRPLRFGIATILGTGKQIISWIHVGDLVRMYIEAMENSQMHGVFNAVSPGPVTNKQFVLDLARARKKFYIPVRIPSFVLKLVLGQMSIEVLKSATVSCEKIQKMGFTFKFPLLGDAFGSMFSTPNPPEGGT